MRYACAIALLLMALPARADDPFAGMFGGDVKPVVVAVTPTERPTRPAPLNRPLHLSDRHDIHTPAGRAAARAELRQRWAERRIARANGTYEEPDPPPAEAAPPVSALQEDDGPSPSKLAKQLDTLEESINHLGDRLETVEKRAQYAVKWVNKLGAGSPTVEQAQGWGEQQPDLDWKPAAPVARAAPARQPVQQVWYQQAYYPTYPQQFYPQQPAAVYAPPPQRQAVARARPGFS